MRVLVLGYGSMGQRHARNAVIEGHEVHVWDPAIAKDNGWFSAPVPGVFLFHNSEKGAWRCKPDAVVIATPAALHAAQLARWDSRHLAVLVEKPVALSQEDYWLARSNDTDRAVMVGYSLRFHPHIRQFKDALGQLHGTPSTWSATAWLDCDMRTWPGTTYAEPLLECSHEVDLVAYLLGHPTCYGASASDDGRRWELVLRCGETRANVHIDAGKPAYERWTAVQDTDGNRVWWGWHAPSGTSILSLPGRPDDRIVCHAEDLYAAEMSAFLRGHREHTCRVSEALAVLHVCDSARNVVGRPMLSG